MVPHAVPMSNKVWGHWAPTSCVLRGRSYLPRIPQVRWSTSAGDMSTGGALAGTQTAHSLARHIKHRRRHRFAESPPLLNERTRIFSDTHI